jgi:VanZ family protein
MRGPRAWRVAAVALAAAIGVVGVLPTQGVMQTIAEGQDNLLASAGHFASYVVLAFVLAVALDDWRLSRRAIVGAAASAFLLGVLIEVLQGPLPYRDCQLGDALANGAGVALGVAFFSVAARARARRPRWRRG